jgi:hypothetical protein
MATSSQKMAVVLAFVAAALSLSAAAIGYAQTGVVRVTPLGGGIFMLALGITGLIRLRARRR